MHRVDDIFALNGLLQEGNSATGQEPHRVRAAWFNVVRGRCWEERSDRREVRSNWELATHVLLPVALPERVGARGVERAVLATF